MIYSLLTFIPNISKWKFNNMIQIINIFKGCNSLLIYPDISKWNISNPEFFKTVSFNSNSFSIKEIKSDSLILGDTMEKLNLSKDLSFLKDENNEKEENKLFSNNEESDDYYDNFYN